MIGMITRDEVQCAISGFNINMERAAAADFVVPIIFNEYNLTILSEGLPITDLVFNRNSLYVKAFGMGGSSAYIYPFTTNTWIATFVTFLLTAMVLSLTMKYGWNEDVIKGSEFSSSFLIVYQSLVLQGTPDEPTKGTSRLVFISAFLGGIVLYTAYSAALTSMLAIKTTKLPFLDERSMVDHSSYDILTMKGTLFDAKYEVRSNHNIVSQLQIQLQLFFSMELRCKGRSSRTGCSLAQTLTL